MDGMNLPEYLLKTNLKDYNHFPPTKQNSDLGLKRKKAGADYRIKTTLSKSPPK
jgi:hypothetical protein